MNYEIYPKRLQKRPDAKAFFFFFDFYLYEIIISVNH